MGEEKPGVWLRLAKVATLQQRRGLAGFLCAGGGFGVAPADGVGGNFRGQLGGNMAWLFVAIFYVLGAVAFSFACIAHGYHKNKDPSWRAALVFAVVAWPISVLVISRLVLRKLVKRRAKIAALDENRTHGGA